MRDLREIADSLAVLIPQIVSDLNHTTEDEMRELSRAYRRTIAVAEETERLAKNLASLARHRAIDATVRRTLGG